MVIDYRLLLVAAIAVSGPAAAAAGSAEAGQKKAVVCMACHGADGNSPAVDAPVGPWPKLAGQTSEYIAKQVHDFKAGKRQNDTMSPQAQAVAEADIADIAAFFASQQIKSETAGDRALLAQGEKLFTKGKGKAAATVAACAGCHGQGGAGKGDWAKFYANPPTLLAPAVGGQHASYVVKQMKAFRDGSRSNDVGKVMRNIAARMDDKDIEAVAAYIATLTR